MSWQQDLIDEQETDWQQDLIDEQLTDFMIEVHMDGMCEIIEELKYHPTFLKRMFEDYESEYAFELLGY